MKFATVDRKGLLLLCLFACAGAAGCRPKAPPLPEPPEPKVSGGRVIFPADAPQLAYLTLQAARPRKLAIAHLTGRLYWNDDATVRVFTPLSGRVSALRADVGESVSVGSPLAEIDSPDYGQAVADARTARANLAEADRAYARAKDLLVHGAAAQKDVEVAEAAYLAAAAERDRSAAKLALYGGDETRAGETYLLRSPLAGMVVERNLNPGQEVRGDQMLANATNLFAPLFVISDPSTLWLQVDATESDLPQLRPGQALQVHSRAFPGETFPGRIESIGPTLDPTTRTVRLRGVVENAGGKLKAEMYVLVDLVEPVEGTAAAGLEVDSKAIFMVAGRDFLFVETAPGRFERREVRVGDERDGKVPILSGVAAGERVVAEGGLLLQSILEPTN